MRRRNGCREVRQGIIRVHRVWYEHLSQTLIRKIGFRVNRKDACVFIKGHGSKQVVTCVHVEDWMITCTDDEEIESIVSSLQKGYTALTVLRGVVHNYLGMRFDWQSVCRSMCKRS